MSKGGMAEKENKDGVKCREHSTIKIATFNFEDLLKYRTCAQIYVFFLSWWDLRPLFFVPVLAFHLFEGQRPERCPLIMKRDEAQRTMGKSSRRSTTIVGQRPALKDFPS